MVPRKLGPLKQLLWCALLVCGAARSAIAQGNPFERECAALPSQDGCTICMKRWGGGIFNCGMPTCAMRVMFDELMMMHN